MQRAEGFAHRAILGRAMHRDQRIGRMIAERLGERDLFFRRRARRRDVGRAEVRDQLLREPFDQGRAIRRARLDDLHQRRPAERLDAEKPAAERRARLALERVGIRVPERERARHRPFAGLGGPLEHERVGGIEPDGADQLHVRGPPLFGSSQDGTPSADASAMRCASVLPARRTSRSPVSSMSRRTPLSAGSRCR